MKNLWPLTIMSFTLKRILNLSFKLSVTLLVKQLTKLDIAHLNTKSDSTKLSLKGPSMLTKLQSVMHTPMMLTPEWNISKMTIFLAP